MSGGGRIGMPMGGMGGSGGAPGLAVGNQPPGDDWNWSQARMDAAKPLPMGRPMPGGMQPVGYGGMQPGGYGGGFGGMQPGNNGGSPGLAVGTASPNPGNDYWTKARMDAAKPLPMGVAPPGGYGGYGGGMGGYGGYGGYGGGYGGFGAMPGGYGGMQPGITAIGGYQGMPGRNGITPLGGYGGGYDRPIQGPSQDELARMAGYGGGQLPSGFPQPSPGFQGTLQDWGRQYNTRSGRYQANKYFRADGTRRVTQQEHDAEIAANLRANPTPEVSAMLPRNHPMFQPYRGTQSGM